MRLALGAVFCAAVPAGLACAQAGATQEDEASSAALPDPAPAPPAPAVLAPFPAAPDRGSSAPPVPQPPLAGAEGLPGGGWRLRLPPAAETPEPDALRAAEEIGRRLAGQATGRVTVMAQVSGPEADVSAARRLSLARGLAVKAALAEGGLDPARIDIRPLGRVAAEAADAVDVLPPGTTRRQRAADGADAAPGTAAR